MAQQVKDLALSQLWFGLVLWGAVSIPGPGTSACHGWDQKKKKKGSIGNKYFIIILLSEKDLLHKCVFAFSQSSLNVLTL